MKRFLKITTSVLCVIVLCITSSACIFKDHVFSWDVRHQAEEWFECVKNRDAEALMRYFSPYIQENRREKTIEELNRLFAFIDGDIVSYVYSSGGLVEKMDHGHIKYYACSPEFRKVTTDKNKMYTVSFGCHYIYEKEPEHQGLEDVVVRSEDSQGNVIRIVAGDYYHESA